MTVQFALHGLSRKSAGAQRTSRSLLRNASSSQKRCHTTKPLSHCFAMPARPKSAITQRTSQSKPFGFASSPIRGATGVPVLVLLDELGFSKPETEVLRCLGAQHRYEFSLVERSLDAVCLDSGALYFAKDKTFIV